MTSNALAQRGKLELKVSARAHVGYLVGYKSTTQYYIYVPAREVVIDTPHVIFDETIRYRDDVPDKLPVPIDPLQELTLDRLLQAMQRFEPRSMEEDWLDNWVIGSSPAAAMPEAALELGGETTPKDAEPPRMLPTPSPSVEPAPAEEIIVATPAEPIVEPATAEEIIVAPPAEPSADIVLPSVETGSNSKQPTPATPSEAPQGPVTKSGRTVKMTEKGAAYAAQKQHDRRAAAVFVVAAVQKWLEEDLPKEPESHAKAKRHDFADQWAQAEVKELETVSERGTYDLVDRSDAKKRILPLKWVYKYKADEQGIVTRFKARICVRGDLQDVTEEETYAATLAIRTFRVMIAVAAKFDLEMTQFDAVGAFTNSDLDEPVWVYPPQGHDVPGKVWRLKKALYGLRLSPRLWYRKLREAFVKVGLTAAYEEVCLFQNDKLVVLVFVDDLVFFYRKRDEDEAKRVEAALKEQIELTGGGRLQWFLRINVIRDREARRIWLVQNQYIERIAQQYNLAAEARPSHGDSPMSAGPGLPKADEDHEPERSFRHLYQSKVGSILYPSVMTRPDTMKAAQELSRHNHRPTVVHMEAADRVIRYLYVTRHLALVYDGNVDGIDCYTDAAFADDVVTRKSSHGYVTKLFGGPVIWKAGQLPTIAPSTTEAELLGLTIAAKEEYALFRLFRDIDLTVEDDLKVLCDNLQTIRLLTKEHAVLTTRLRHIDIHRHWARQEVQNGNLKVEWIGTKDMVADGLTKLLPKIQHQTFILQLGLEDIRFRITVEEATT